MNYRLNQNLKQITIRKLTAQKKSDILKYRSFFNITKLFLLSSIPLLPYQQLLGTEQPNEPLNRNYRLSL